MDARDTLAVYLVDIGQTDDVPDLIVTRMMAAADTYLAGFGTAEAIGTERRVLAEAYEAKAPDDEISRAFVAKLLNPT